MNQSPWKRRIERASGLLTVFPEAGELLKFYCRLSSFQESLFESLQNSGRTDLNAVAKHVPALCALLQAENTLTLADRSSQLLAKGVESWEAMLRIRWENGRSELVPDDKEEFFSRALLQPYAEYLASRGDVPNQGEGTCPFCTARPIVSVLKPEGDGGKRFLLCSLCSTEWEYRRIVCPCCGETDKDKLPIYKAEGIEHVRIEACDSCRRYLKSIDLTVNGLAVSVVDEIATVTLDVWAEENGYGKLQPNLLGL
jgi:FdhE protein